MSKGKKDLTNKNATNSIENRVDNASKNRNEQNRDTDRKDTERNEYE